MKEQLREAHTRTMLSRGANSPSTLEPLVLAKTSSWTPSQDPKQNKIIGAFAMALRDGRFSSAAHDTLALGTIQKTISDISAAFRETVQPNPTKDNDLQLSIILQCQFQAYKNADPKEH